jgi:hypothetical protein
VYIINIYLSFIRPILEYGNVIWDNCTQNEANLLESVQVEADRIITGLRVNSSSSKLYSELGSAREPQRVPSVREGRVYILILY